MNIERVFPSGAWRISAMVDGCRFSRLYFDFTKAEAVRQFRLETGAV